MTVTVAPANSRSGRQLDIRPFRAWLRAQIAHERRVRSPDAYRSLAGRLGVNDRTLRRWLADGDWIDESTVDRVASHDGSVMVWEIYDARYDEAEGLPDGQVVVDSVCSTPGCGGSRNGGRFCHEHTERLAEIRAELEREAAILASHGGARRDQARGRARVVRAPTCCNPHCWEPRESGQRFCWSCQDDGWTEESE